MGDSNSRVAQVTVIGRGATVAAVNNTVSSVNVGSQSPYLALTPPGGSNGQLEYNDGGGFNGTSGITWDKTVNQLYLTNSSLVLNNSPITITGINQANAFSIRTGNIDIVKVDTLNRRIYFNVGGVNSDYYIGIGTNNPLEKVHIASGNLRVDGTGYFSGLVVNGDNLYTKGDFKFFTANVTSGVLEQDINYPTNLSYTPKLITDIKCSNPDERIFYATYISNITNTGFRAEYSNVIHTTGYVLEIFVASSFY